MPFTPYHFGPGLLGKTIAPRYFSLLAFLATQVTIDLETAYNLWAGRRPLHRFFHSIPGSMLAGLAVAAALAVLARLARDRIPRVPVLAADLTGRALLIGGLLGGASHAVLDNILHRDSRLLYPFAPFGAELHGAIGYAELHLACLACGAVGLVLLCIRLLTARAG